MSTSRAESEWWRDTPRLASRLLGDSSPPGPGLRSYLLGDGTLELDVDDPGFSCRFDEIYRDCLLRTNGSGDRVQRVRVRLSVRSDDSLPVRGVRISDPGMIEPLSFLLALFRDRGYREMDVAQEGWRFVESRESPGRAILALNGSLALVSETKDWQALVTSFAVNRLLRLQQHMLFFHAGSLAMQGRGVLLMGDKGRGKTTLSLTLAARGHEFLGDEVAALRTDNPLELLPFRRSLSVRQGPASAVIDALVTEPTNESSEVERFPDASWRRRWRPAGLFPSPAAPSYPLRAIFLLDAFESETRIERLPASREVLRRLTPLEASLWGKGKGQRFRDMLELVTQTPCFVLHPGAPEQAAKALEALILGSHSKGDAELPSRLSGEGR